MLPKLFLFVCVCLTTVWSGCAAEDDKILARGMPGNMTLKSTRASYYCEWRYWRNTYWTDLLEVDFHNGALTVAYK